jgi:hypothetical protein
MRIEIEITPEPADSEDMARVLMSAVARIADGQRAGQYQGHDQLAFTVLVMGGSYDRHYDYKWGIMA